MKRRGFFAALGTIVVPWNPERIYSHAPKPLDTSAGLQEWGRQKAALFEGLTFNGRIMAYGLDASDRAMVWTPGGSWTGTDFADCLRQAEQSGYPPPASVFLMNAAEMARRMAES